MGCALRQAQGERGMLACALRPCLAASAMPSHPFALSRELVERSKGERMALGLRRACFEYGLRIRRERRGFALRQAQGERGMLACALRPCLAASAMPSHPFALSRELVERSKGERMALGLRRACFEYGLRIRRERRGFALRQAQGERGMLACALRPCLAASAMLPHPFALSRELVERSKGERMALGLRRACFEYGLRIRRERREFVLRQTQDERLVFACARRQVSGLRRARGGRWLKLASLAHLARNSFRIPFTRSHRRCCPIRSP